MSTTVPQITVGATVRFRHGDARSFHVTNVTGDNGDCRVTIQRGEGTDRVTFVIPPINLVLVAPPKTSPAN